MSQLTQELAEQVLANNTVDIMNVSTSANNYELTSVITDSFGRCTRYVIDMKFPNYYMQVEFSLDIINTKVVKINIFQIAHIHPTNDIRCFGSFARVQYIQTGDDWANYVTSPLMRFKDVSYCLTYLDPIIENFISDQCVEEQNRNPIPRPNHKKFDLITKKFNQVEAPNMPVICKFSEQNNNINV